VSPLGPRDGRPPARRGDQGPVLPGARALEL